MSSSTSRFAAIGLAIAALALAGCANTGGTNLFGSTAVKPKTVLVTDFTVAPDVDAIDREQGWIAAPEATAAPEEPVKLPQAKPAQKPKAAKPDKPAT